MVDRYRNLAIPGTQKYWDEDICTPAPSIKPDLPFLARFEDPAYREEPHPPREIFVPIDSLSHCAHCHATGQLKVCISCASSVYCSRECQKNDWPSHQKTCSQSEKLNLKTFYVFIAYLFETARELGEPCCPPHPALYRNVVKAPLPVAKKANKPGSIIEHTVILGDKEFGPDPDIHAWLKAFTPGNAPDSTNVRKYTLHFLREVNSLEITISVCLTLVSGIYFALLTKDGPIGPFHRLEYGQNPICDFGIAKGKIRGKTHCVQKWTYYDTKSKTRLKLKDPDDHYWLYFKTLTGEEIILDCNSSSFGMDVFVDIELLMSKLPKDVETLGARRVPAFFKGPNDRGPHPYTLIEEKRFSVMRNTELHKALMLQFPKEERPEDRAVIRGFIEMVQGKPCTPRQENRIWRQRVAQYTIDLMFLRDKVYKSLGKPITYTKDSFFASPGMPPGAS